MTLSLEHSLFIIKIGFFNIFINLFNFCYFMFCLKENLKNNSASFGMKARQREIKMILFLYKHKTLFI